jgi:hypothetical protein
MIDSPLLFASFWGFQWQDDAAHEAPATEIIRALSGLQAKARIGAFVQSSFYTRGGWLDGTNPTALSARYICAAIQNMIDREALPDVNRKEGDGPTTFFLILLDETLSLAGAGVEPYGARHGHFETFRGNPFYFGVIPSGRQEGAAAASDPVARLAIAAESVVAAMRAHPAPTEGWTVVPGAEEAHAAIAGRGEPPQEGARTPIWPSLYIENRTPRFRVEGKELGRFLDQLAAPIGIEDVPGAAIVLKYGAELVERRIVERARRPRPASPLELREFTRPLPHLTIAERFAALQSMIGENHPDVALVKKILAHVPETAVAELARKYVDDGAFRFLDPVFWIYYKLLLARELGLDTSPPRSIWDIGCGGGHFSLVCQHLGHRVLGTDVNHPVYRDIAAVLGVERRIDMLLPDTPTTDFGRKFDVITAGQIEFDRIRPYTDPPRLWSLDQWKFLLNDVMTRQMIFPGRIYIELNYATRDGRAVFDVDLLQLCAGYGAEVSERRGIINWKLDAPIAL